MLCLAARSERVFQLNRPKGGEPFLVGLTARAENFGIEDPADELIFAGGRGRTLSEAFAGCIGEAFERLSLQWRPTCATEQTANMLRLSPESVSGFWASGERLADRMPVLMAAEQIFRMPEGKAPGCLLAPSEGVAVGADRNAAGLGAMFELIERDAVSLWWLGGRPGYDVRDGDRVLDEVFPSPGKRRRWLLELSREFGVFVCVAISTDHDGVGMVVGAGCATELEISALKAATELFQMEIAANLSKQKKRQGIRLQQADEQWLRRLSMPIREFPIALPSTIRAHKAVRQDVAPVEATAFGFDLTLPGYSFYSVRVISNHLQPGHAEPGPRLLAAIASSNHDYMRHADAPRPI